MGVYEDNIMDYGDNDDFYEEYEETMKSRDHWYSAYSWEKGFPVQLPYWCTRQTHHSRLRMFRKMYNRGTNTYNELYERYRRWRDTWEMKEPPTRVELYNIAQDYCKRKWTYRRIAETFNANKWHNNHGTPWNVGSIHALCNRSKKINNYEPVRDYLLSMYREGSSPSQIALVLNDKGWKSRTGRPFTGEMVSQVVRYAKWNNEL